MCDKRCYKRHYYINGEWQEDPQDPPKDYDLAIFVCNKSEADILKNKVSDSIIKNIKDSDTRSVFEDYNNYKYISLNIFNKIVSREEEPYLIIDNKNIYSLNEIISNIAIVIFEKEFYVFFEKEFYVFADDIFAGYELIDWINRVVDMFKQDVDKFKQEKRVLGSVFIYYFLFDSMSNLNSMLEDLYMLIYHYSKQSIAIIEPKIPNPKDQEIQINLMKNLIEIKDLILELRIYLTYIKEVLRKIRPLFRETSEYYNKLSDIKEECDDELYKLEQNIQNAISTTFLLADRRETKATKLLTATSVTLVPISILVSILVILVNTYGIGLEYLQIILNLITIILILAMLVVFFTLKKY